MMRYTRRAIILPLINISTNLKSLTTNRDISQILPVETNDEIGDISKEINALLAEFQNITKTLWIPL
ncbi:MAG: hypothetical protein RQ783_08125 [Gammaproteobacteria bacterium]|nr:hypothetical protein [Gammaproteobacteria bacterium]